MKGYETEDKAVAVAGRMIFYVIIGAALFTMLLFMAGCQNTAPTLEVESILTEPAEPKRSCIRVAALPRCPARTIQWVEYRNGGRCVWAWGCI